MTIAALITQTENFIAELEKSRAHFGRVMLGEGWIVQNHGIALSFTITNGVATDPVSVGGNPAFAHRFTERDARTLAAAVTNGNGEHAVAIHVADAVRAAIVEQGELLAMLKAHAAK